MTGSVDTGGENTLKKKEVVSLFLLQQEVTA
jgi:hypothetical protein